MLNKSDVILLSGLVPFMLGGSSGGANNMYPVRYPNSQTIQEYRDWVCNRLSHDTPYGECGPNVSGFDSRDLDDVYEVLTGQKYSVKRGMFGLRNYQSPALKKQFSEALNNLISSALPGIPKPLVDRWDNRSRGDTWFGFHSHNDGESNRYNFKMYVSVILDGTAESVLDYWKVIGAFGKHAFHTNRPSTEYAGLKFAASADAIRNHYDTIVLHSNSLDYIERVKSSWVPKIAGLNNKLNNALILTPEQRYTVFMKGTIGADTPQDSDTYGLARWLISQAPTNKNQACALLEQWANMLPMQKMELMKSLMV